MRRFAWPVAIVLAIAVSAPASAGTGLTYHGLLGGASFSCKGAPITSPYESVDGSWNLNVSGSTAVITINVSYDGRHHLSFGMPGGTVVSVTRDAAIVEFGDATATVSGGTFEWSLPLGYDCPADIAYDALVYLGTVGR